MQEQNEQRTMEVTHYARNTSFDPLNYEGANLTLPFPFSVLSRRAHESGKPSLWIYTIQPRARMV